MVINRITGLVLPASTKFLVDDVIGKHRSSLLPPLVGAVLLATLLQGITSFALTQTLSKAAQRLIAELRSRVQEHIGRLPLSYFDSAKTGALVSRIMTDVEGVRNLVGTGLIDFAGGLLTAAIAFVVLVRISPIMTAIAFGFLLVFGVGLRKAFQTIRPIFRERGKINAEVTGRLTESLGGVRVVKGYRAEAREHAVFAAGLDRLLQNVFRTTYALELPSAGSFGGANYYVKSLRYGGREYPADAVDLSGDGELEIVVSPLGATVEGTAVDAAGKPSPNAVVVIAPASGVGPLKNGAADARGNFYFGGLAPGEYRVFAWDAGSAEATDPPPSLAPYQSAAKTVRLEQSAREKTQVTVIAAK